MNINLLHINSDEIRHCVNIICHQLTSDLERYKNYTTTTSFIRKDIII